MKFLSKLLKLGHVCILGQSIKTKSVVIKAETLRPCAEVVPDRAVPCRLELVGAAPGAKGRVSMVGVRCGERQR